MVHDVPRRALYGYSNRHAAASHRLEQSLGDILPSRGAKLLVGGGQSLPSFTATLRTFGATIAWQ
jgi:hypothetical protein